MNIEALNAVNHQKNIVKVTSLKKNFKYRVLDFNLIKSKVGTCWVVDLEDFSVFLPNRFTNKISKKQVEKFHKTNQILYLIYRGQLEVGKPSKKIIIEFSGGNKSTGEHEELPITDGEDSDATEMIPTTSTNTQQRKRKQSFIQKHSSGKSTKIDIGEGETSDADLLDEEFSQRF